MKSPVVILSFVEPESCGGFTWELDTPESRKRLVAAGAKEAQSYRDVIVLAAAVEAGETPEATTELLDRGLVFESGLVGEVLYRSKTWGREAR